MKAPESAIVNGLEVRVDRLAPEGEELGTLVLIHGVGNGIDGWDSVVAALPPQWRVIRYSLRGHGESRKPEGPYTLDDFVDDHNTLIADLGVDSYHLIGCSLGGLIAQGVALTHPSGLNRLILLSCIAGRSPAQKHAALERLRALEEAGGPIGMAAQSAERWFTSEFLANNPEVVERRLKAYKSNHVPSYLASYKVLAESDLIDQLHEITNETMVVTGEFDIGSPPAMANNIVSQIPDASLEIIAGQKHQLLIEAPEIVAHLISQFAAHGLERTIGEQ